MDPQSILITLVVIIGAEFFLESLLGRLNLKNQKSSVPSLLSDVYSPEELLRANAYHRDSWRLGMIKSTLTVLVYLGLLWFGVLGQIDSIVASWTDHELLHPLIFFGVLYFASDLLALPFSYYRNFVIEERFGFNKMSIGTFIRDKLKGYLLIILIGGGILSIFLILVNWLGALFWLYFWAVVTAFILFTNLFYTNLILPLFNKLTPLEEGELRTAIEKYANSVNFPLTNIFVIDGSKRSSKSNAYFTGFGKQKKVVFFDTLIENHSTEELVAVMAHEVGHYKKKHIISGFFLSILQSGLILFLLSLFINTKEFSLALGGNENSIQLNLIVFGMLFTPISKISGILMNLFSRRNEYQADAYAFETSSAEALSKALKTLSGKNLSNITPHPAFVFFHYSHPPLYNRLQAIERLKS